jgi:copper chaperone
MKTTFTVNGMKCVHCKANVESALKNLKGVSDAVVSLDDHNVTVDYDASQVSAPEMKEAVDNSGHYEFVL